MRCCFWHNNVSSNFKSTAFRSIWCARIRIGQFRGKEILYSMKRPYELTFVLRIDPNEQVMKDNVAKVQSWVEVEETGKVNKIDTNHWGRRRLAYEIDGQREGYYVMMYADIDTDNLEELDRNLKLSPFILRHLLIRTD